MEMTSLLEKVVITPRLGGSTDMLLIYGQTFSSFENGPGWVAFECRKWFEISDEHAFYKLENGPDQILIFIMKMV
jgi:hypothetical protein